MQIIKLNATDSTNLFLKRLVREGSVMDNTVVVAEYQTEGRGQIGNSWVSEPGKNLIFSVFKQLPFPAADKQFYISMAVALAVYNALKNIGVLELSIKWPNDILSANKKIGGILIENTIKNTKTQDVIIGVGLNVNQQDFPGLPRASSLKNITGITHDPDDILREILKALEVFIGMLIREEFPALKTQYEMHLFRTGKVSTFKDRNAALFTGIIQGVTDEGKLIVLLEDEVTKAFDHKEIALLY